MLTSKSHVYNLLNLCSRLINSCVRVHELISLEHTLTCVHELVFFCSQNILFVHISVVYCNLTVTVNSRGWSVKLLSLLYSQSGRSLQNASSRLAAVFCIYWTYLFVITFLCYHIQTVIIAISTLSAILASFSCCQSCAHIQSPVQPKAANS